MPPDPELNDSEYENQQADAERAAEDEDSGNPYAGWTKRNWEIYYAEGKR